jgi:hypothetical protein
MLVKVTRQSVCTFSFRTGPSAYMLAILLIFNYFSNKFAVEKKIGLCLCQSYSMRNYGNGNVFECEKAVLGKQLKVPKFTMSSQSATLATDSSSALILLPSPLSSSLLSSSA